jgi:putative oxidoreductase
MLRRLLAPSPAGPLVSLGLLAMRLWFCLTLSYLHGWEAKIVPWSTLKDTFQDPYHVGHTMSLALAIFGEVGMSILVILGLGTRPAALILSFTLATAWLARHGLQLSEGNSELAFIYLGGFVALLIAGPGRYSLDQRLFGRR